MGLLTKEVEIDVSGKEKSYYQNLGYKIPEILKHGKLHTIKGTKIFVNVKDLPSKSMASVEIKCDCCEKNINIAWNNYLKYKHEDGKYYCHNCSRHLFSSNSIKKALLKKSKSFYDWCIENNRQDLLDRWDYELNKCSPKDVCIGSHGINNKGYWLKCLENHNHHSELKDIRNLVNGKIKTVDCLQCHSIGMYLSKNFDNGIKLYWSDKNIVNPFEISYSSRKNIYLKCPKCGEEKCITPDLFVNKGISCKKCSDGISYPERFMYNLLKQLNIDFEYQYCPKWIAPKRYDFYISSLNCIIETHGTQHYEEIHRNGARSLQEEQENDIFKKQFAIINGIDHDHYIVIDCRQSNMNWIRGNILKSKLAILFDLSKINWNKADEESQTSLVKKVCELWNSGIHNSTNIGTILKLNRSTVNRYLNRGNGLGLCVYTKNLVKVYCIELDKIFDSITEASQLTQIRITSIEACCKGSYHTAGGYHWLFYEDYLKQQKAS